MRDFVYIGCKHYSDFEQLYLVKELVGLYSTRKDELIILYRACDSSVKMRCALFWKRKMKVTDILCLYPEKKLKNYIFYVYIPGI